MLHYSSFCPLFSQCNPIYEKGKIEKLSELFLDMKHNHIFFCNSFQKSQLLISSSFFKKDCLQHYQFTNLQNLEQQQAILCLNLLNMDCSRHRVLRPQFTYLKNPPSPRHAFSGAKSLGEQCLLKSFCSLWQNPYTDFEKKLFGY